MSVEYCRELSRKLNRDMEFRVHGYAGIPCLILPAQDGRFHDSEDFGMIGAAHEYVDASRIRFFYCDDVDNETRSNVGGNSREYMEQHERYYHYIIGELISHIREISTYANSGKEPHDMMTCGCSLGASHALNLPL